MTVSLVAVLLCLLDSEVYELQRIQLLYISKGSYLCVTLSIVEGSRWDKSSESQRASCLIPRVELSQRKQGELCSCSSYP